MAVPKDLQKELMISVEHRDVAISPPVLDSIILTGHAPAPDPRTMLFTGYTDDILSVRTVSGQIFQIGEVVQPTTIVMEQVLVGHGVPSIDGEYNNRIFMDGTGRGIYIWNDPGDTNWDNPQVVVVQSVRPPSAQVDQIFISVADRSIWVWSS